jgi:hypothetical protein
MFPLVYNEALKAEKAVICLSKACVELGACVPEMKSVVLFIHISPSV